MTTPIWRTWACHVKHFKGERKIFPRELVLTCKGVDRRPITNYSKEAPVVFEVRRKRGVITLNRPQAMNALTVDMVMSLKETLRDWRNKLELVVIKSSSEAFCSGADLLAIYDKGVEEGDRYGREIYGLEYLIHTLSIPIVPIVGGLSMGSGLGISVHAEMQIVTEKATMSMPETSIGFHPDAGASYFFSRLPGGLGMYLGLTGHRLRGKDLVQSGLASHFVESSRMIEVENALMNASIPVENISRTISDAHPMNIDKSVHVFPDPVRNIVDKVFTRPRLEDMVGELEADGSEWSKATLQTLGKKSPTSLKIAVRSIQEGKKKTLKECFQMEHKISTAILHSLVSNDFYEGVRALIVDKDRAPKWDPPSIDGVSDDDIDKVFNLKISKSLEMSLED